MENRFQHGAGGAFAVGEYGLKLSPLEDFKKLDALIIAVSHKEYLAMGQPKICGLVKDGGVIADVKSALDPHKMERGITYWSL